MPSPTIVVSTYGVPVFKILHAAFIAPGIKRFVIEAPRIARKQRPGQFVILRLYEQGERIPLTIERSDPERGTINIVVQSAGKTTHLLNSLETGDRILDVVGPLGKPSEIENFGTVVVIGGGVGTAMAYPTAAALKKAGNRVISIVGARNKELVILEQEMARGQRHAAAHHRRWQLRRQGLRHRQAAPTHQERHAHRPGLAVGPIPMMKAVAEMTRKEHIRTIVSLNPIMIDGTGMCGGCRVLIDSKSEFACVDGPEFDAHRVNFEVLVQRNAMYREAERKSMAGIPAAKSMPSADLGTRRNLTSFAPTSGGQR